MKTSWVQACRSMMSRALVVLIGFLSLFSSNPVFSEENIIFSNGKEKQSLNSYLEYFDDVNGDHDIIQVSSQAFSSFQQLTPMKPLGYD